MRTDDLYSLELSEEAIGTIDALKKAFNDFAQRMQELFEEIAGCAEEKETTSFVVSCFCFCIYTILKIDKEDTNHYFAMSRGPPERSEHNI